LTPNSLSPYTFPARIKAPCPLAPYCLEIPEALTEGKDLMVPILQAWKAGATMGEIGGMLRMAYDFPYDPHGFLDPPA